MNNDKIYTAIIEMLQCYERETGREKEGDLNKLVNDSQRLRELAVFTGCPNIYASAARVLVDLRESIDKKKTGGAGLVNVCKRLVKECSRPDLAGMGYDDITKKYYILDGYRMFRFSEDLPSLPRMRGTFEHEKVVPQDRTENQLPTPSMSELKSHIAINNLRRNKNDNRTAYTPQGWPAWIKLNVYYIMDVLQAVGPDVVFYEPARAKQAVYFTDGSEDAKTDGIVLPIWNDAARQAWAEEDERRQEERHNRKSA